MRLVPIPETRVFEAIRKDLAPGTFCDLLKEILECRLSDLTERKEKKDGTAKKVQALQDLVKAHRDDTAFPKEAMDKLLEALAARKKEKQAADEAYSDRDDATRLVLAGRKEYVDRFCEQRGWPEAFYSAHVGAEGTFDESSFGLRDGNLQANLFFATPFIYLRTPNAKVKILGTEKKLLCSGKDGKPALKPFAKLSPSDDRRFLLAGFSRGGNLHFERDSGKTYCASGAGKGTAECVSFAALLAKRESALNAKRMKEKNDAEVCIESLSKDVIGAQKAATEHAETVSRLAAVVTYFLGKLPDTGCPGGQSRPDWPPECRELHRAQLELKEAKASSEAGQAELELNQKGLARQTKARKEAEDARPLCEAAVEVDELIAALDRLDMGEWRGREGYRSDRSLDDPPRQVRVGPFQIPDPVKLQTAPIWAFVKVAVSARALWQ